jgi:hypothetical protein
MSRAFEAFGAMDDRPCFALRKKTDLQTVRLDSELKGWVNAEAIRLADELDNGSVGASTLIRDALRIYRRIFRIRELFHDDSFLEKVFELSEKDR